LKFMEFHKEIDKTLKYFINEIKKENPILKEKLKELENALLPRPFSVKPVVAIQPLYGLEDVMETSSRLKGSSSLLTTVRKYIGDNIHKRIALILETWELGTSSGTLSTRILHFK